MLRVRVRRLERGKSLVLIAYNIDCSTPIPPISLDYCKCVNSSSNPFNLIAVQQCLPFPRLVSIGIGIQAPGKRTFWYHLAPAS